MTSTPLKDLLASQAQPATASRYMLPSAPCSVITKRGARIECPDGILYADTPELEALAQDLLAAGNCIRYEAGDPVPSQLRPVDLRVG